MANYQPNNCGGACAPPQDAQKSLALTPSLPRDLTGECDLQDKQAANDSLPSKQELHECTESNGQAPGEVAGVYNEPKLFWQRKR